MTQYSQQELEGLRVYIEQLHAVAKAAKALMDNHEIMSETCRYCDEDWTHAERLHAALAELEQK